MFHTKTPTIREITGPDAAMSIFQKVSAKSWLPGSDKFPGQSSDGFDLPKEKIGLGALLFVVVVLFFLLTSAYFMRMNMGPDWVPLPDPQLLWVNTGFLLLSSLAMQWAVSMGKRGNNNGLSTGFIIGGLLALAFLTGQYIAWQQLVELGYFAATNPANAFFYLITGMHGIHMAGGMVAWFRAASHLNTDTDEGREDLQLRVELCTIYWHFLLLIWCGLFAVLLKT